jgi:hypothetical protein
MNSLSTCFPSILHQAIRTTKDESGSSSALFESDNQRIENGGLDQDEDKRAILSFFCKLLTIAPPWREESDAWSAPSSTNVAAMKMKCGN